jgi:integrase
MSSHSNGKGRPRKAADRPKKPYPDFPLSPHPSGAWQKKIRGRIHYFGRWGRRVGGKMERVEGDGWKEALEEYKAVADDLHAGRAPRVKGDGLTVADLCNRFLTAKLHKRTSGEIGPRMFEEYKEATDLIVATFGKTRQVDDLVGDDFEKLRATMAERWGPVRLGNGITRVKSVFKYGTDNGLIEKTVRYGGEFKKPGKTVLRRHRAQAGEKMIEAATLRALIEGCLVVGDDGPALVRADTQLRAMILLGVNAGFGNHDVATLPLSALDLERGWITFARPKTGILRRCPIWDCTADALRQVIAERREPRHEEASGLVFINPRGLQWVRNTKKSRTDNISVLFANLLKQLGMHREGLNFYALRHVFRTVADAARDPVAIDMIMGHTDDSMADHYRERVEDSRLRAVVDLVRAWLFGSNAGPEPARDETNLAEANTGTVN